MLVTLHLRGLYRGLRDTGYLPFYFQGYRILFILLPGIWDIVSNIFLTFRDIEYLGKLILGLFTRVLGILACLLQGIWDIWYPLYKPHLQSFIKINTCPRGKKNLTSQNYLILSLPLNMQKSKPSHAFACDGENLFAFR